MGKAKEGWKEGKPKDQETDPLLTIPFILLCQLSSSSGKNVKERIPLAIYFMHQ